MKNKKIYIITDAPIPIGMASTNRILSYAEGFKKNSVNCEIIIFRKTEYFNDVRNEKAAGVINGINYQYLFHSPIKSTKFIKRRYENFLGSIRLLIFALKRIKKKNIVIYYSCYTFPAIQLKIAKIFNKFFLLKEENENPYVYTKTMNALNKLIFLKFHYLLFDGYLLMTKNLVDYFNTKYPHKPKALIPMTVDIERFKNSNIKKKKYITYVGTLNDEKEGISILIKAFARISNKFPEYTLSLYGDVNSLKDLEKFLDLVKKTGLENRVFFKGKISNELIPKKLLESSVLVMARPDSLQAKNGFPTKLGEYLATGNPVIVTSVGEIPKYLDDNVSAFIAIPGNVKSLSNKMLEVLNDYQNSINVGLNGRIIAEKYFNNVFQSKKIIEFIEKRLCVE